MHTYGEKERERKTERGLVLGISHVIMGWRVPGVVSANGN